MTLALRIRSCLCLAMVVSLLPSLCRAQQESPSPAVPELLQGLSSDSRSMRVKSELDLIAGGEVILDQLPSPGDVPEAAVRDALIRIRDRIEFNAAESALKNQVLTISPARSLADFLDELTTQTGNRVVAKSLETELQGLAAPSSARTGSFFELLDQALEVEGLSWQWGRDGNSAEITREAEGVNAVPMSYDRGFRFQLIEFRELRNFVDPEFRQIFRLGLALDCEPRLKPYWLSIAETDIILTGIPQNPDLLNPKAHREISPQGRRFPFPFDFTVPSRQVPLFISLQGQVTLRVAIRPKVLAFQANDERGLKFHSGNMQVSLEDWQQQNDTLVVLRVEFGRPAPELESHRQGALHRDIALKLPDGSMLRPVDLQLRQSDGLVHLVEYRFATGGAIEGAEFRYLAPTLVTSLPLQFSFKNVPVPRD